MNNVDLGERDDFANVSNVSVKKFKADYLNWLAAYLEPGNLYESFLVELLYDMPFKVIVEEDGHRISDVLELRRRYEKMCGDSLGEEELTAWPPSVLEILVVLAMKMAYLSNDYDNSKDAENLVPAFYHEMLENMGIDRDFDDDWKRKEGMIRKVIGKWLRRKYGKDGSGGLFPLRHPKKDQRDVELWYQMNAYMIENH